MWWCGKNHVSFSEDGGAREVRRRDEGSSGLAHLIKSCLKVLTYSPSVKSWPLTFQKSLMLAYKGFPLQQRAGDILDWWIGHLLVWMPVSCCWWSEVLREEITTNLELIHVVYWQVVQHLTGVCPAWEEPENNRSKKKKAESSEQSCCALI